MKLRLNKWRHYLVALTALVAVATGLAATPLRKTLTPFVTRPLGSWSLPVARSTGQTTPATEFHASSAGASRTDELEGLAALSDRKLAPAGDAIAEAAAGDVVEHGSGSAASTSTDERQDKGWKLGSEKSGRSFSFGRSGGARYSPGSGRSAFSGSGSIGRAGSSGSNSDNASGGGGSARGGVNDPGPIFNEHKSGLPELTGGKLQAAGGGAVIGGRATLASNPEPSTLILFGTGLATAVGSIRRRLRRQ